MRKVLLLGGGYATLSFLKSLDNNKVAEYDFTLISKENHHYQSVLLHEAVSSGKNVSISFDEILPKNFSFIQDEIKEIKENEVLGKKGNYKYDMLVVGLGFSSDDFKIPGVKEYAFSMVDFTNSLKIHEQIKNHGDNLEIVVCGGGFSGIELVGNLVKDLKKLYKNFKIKCVEAMPIILPMFEEELSLKAKAYLEDLGVEFYLSSKILKCEKDGVIIQNNDKEEKIKADIILWTAGVKGNEVIQNSPFFKSQRSKVEVDEFLNPSNQEKEMKNIFIIGDCAALKAPDGRFFPPTAQLANEEGKYLAKVFNSNFNTQERFSYKSKATICSLGNDYAIGVIGSTKVEGKIASYLKKLVEFKWLVKIKGLKAFF
ncbi:NAD(P)/FAD-dependent oxidoreductase [Campylobacter avium]|uniref:NAD(P)/FAD-dependent oxidoreductase n=1 Tax=Campylobacter avium TaxID=522485 RepID=UPI0023544958|nr:NAD(P)/FAD-dependent oxidoreductase [Campylobacter avium]